jgi:hypothetical protein
MEQYKNLPKNLTEPAVEDFIDRLASITMEDDARSEAPENSIIVPEVFVGRVDFEPAVAAGAAPAAEKLSKENQQLIRKFVDEVAKLASENNDYGQLQESIKTVLEAQYDELLATGLFARYSNEVPALTKDEQIAKAAKDYAIFGKLCKDEDYAAAVNFNADAAIGADAMKNHFHSLIGLENPANEVDGNNISWVDSDNITSRQNAQNVSGVEMFFHQRLMIQSNVRNLEKEFELEKERSPDLEKSEFLAQRFAGGAVDDSEHMGLAKVYKGDLGVLQDGTLNYDDCEFTNQGLAMQLAFFQAQEQELQRLRRFGDNPFSAQMLEEMNYQEFALIANLIGRAEKDGANDIGADLLAVFGGETSSEKAKEVFFFYENYVYATASKAAGFELGDGEDEQVRIKKLQEFAQRLLDSDPAVFSDEKNIVSNLLFGEDGDFLSGNIFDEDEPSIYRKLEKKDILEIRKILFPYILREKTQEILASFKGNTVKQNQKLFEETNSYESDLALGIRRGVLENASDEFFESRKERRLQRAENLPPKLSDVRAARIGIGGSLNVDPSFITDKEKGIADPQKTGFSYEYDYKFNDLQEGLVEEKISSFKEAKEIAKADLDQYLTEENNFGDRSFEGADKLNLLNGFIVADFGKPSCLADFAKAIDKMPSDFAKAELAAGRAVFNIASLSGDDGQNRKNTVALIRQLPGYDSPIVTFTTRDILERSINQQSENFFEKQLKAEVQMANLQQMAGITTVYLNDLISEKYNKEYNGKKKIVNGVSVDYTPEDVLALPEVKELSRLNYYMQACMQKFAFKDEDSLEVRNEKIAALQQFMESPNGMPRVLESGMEDGSKIEKLPDLLAKISANFAKQEGKAAPDNADSSLAKRFAALSEQIISQEKSLELSDNLVARAKKSASEQMQQYLQGKEIAAAKTSELKTRLTDSDVKKMQGDFYRLNGARPNFTKGGKTDFDSLLTSEIPKSPFPGISIYKPKGLFGKEAKAIVSFDLPKDPDQLAEFDDIAWIYLPGTSECYIKARVAKEDGPISYYKDGKLVTKECKSGEVLIDEGVIYHKGKNANYMPISAKEKELAQVFGKLDAKRAAKIHKEFSVLAVSSIGGERMGVSTLFKGEAINKDAQQVKARVAAVNTSLEMQRSANLECKFMVGGDGRIASNSNLKDLGIVGDYGLEALKERGREFTGNVGGQKLSDNAFRIINEQGLDIDGLNIPVGKISANSLKIYHGVNMSGGKKAIAIDPPIVVLSYEAADGSKKEASFQLDKENFKKIVMSGGVDDATADRGHSDVVKAIEESRQKDFAQVLDCKPASVKDGIELPPEFGEFKSEFKPEELRVVRQVIATRENKKDVLSLGELLIEYYPDKSQLEPTYMALTKANLQKLYNEDISDETYQKFAAGLEARSQAAQYSVLMDNGDAKKTLTIKDGDNLEVTPKKVSKAAETPDGTCRPVEASLFLGSLQAVAQTVMAH